MIYNVYKAVQAALICSSGVHAGHSHSTSKEKAEHKYPVDSHSSRNVDSCQSLSTNIAFGDFAFPVAHKRVLESANH